MDSFSLLKRKILGLFVCLILISSVSSALGISDDAPITEVNPDVIDLINQVNQSLIYNYLKGLVDIGPRFVGSKNCKVAANYIHDEFTKMGLKSYIDPWRYSFRKCQNVVATLEGSDPDSDAVFIICAHYDTITMSPLFFIIPPKNHSVGANDDGSGVVAMLSIAKIMSSYNFNHTVKFIAFSGEEVGCFGSHDYVRKAYFRGENIIGALNIDTIGGATTKEDGSNVDILLKPRSQWIYDFSKEISEKYYNLIEITPNQKPNMPCDHQSFLDYGYDGVYFGQYEALDIGKIHCPGDNIDKINFTYLSKVTKYILAITCELANKPINLQVRLTYPYEAYIHILDNPIKKRINLNLDRFKYDGSTLLFGCCTARANVTSVDEIEKVIFSIDGDMLDSSKDYPYESPIKGFCVPLFGRHTLGVTAHTKTGLTSYDEMDITIFELRFSLWFPFPIWQHR